jgi:hypothetical protein
MRIAMYLYTTLSRPSGKQRNRMLASAAALVLTQSLLVAAALGQQPERLDLGPVGSGADVSFTRSPSGEWGIEINGGPAPRLQQPRPAEIEVFQTFEDIQDLAAGYESVRKSDTGIDADAEVARGNKAVFRIHDRWSIHSGILALQRSVQVKGNAPGGFYSAIDLSMDRAVSWSNINFMVPGAIYGDPTYDGDRSPGGTLNYTARHFEMREDILAAPLFALSFSNGASLAMLDPAPRGDTTEEE